MNRNYLKLKELFKQKDFLTRIIIVNVVVYILMFFINLFTPLITGNYPSTIVEEYLFPYLALNSNLFNLLLRPWTLISHLFIHELTPWHVIGNMLLLYYLGKLFLNYFTPKQLVGLYFLGGITGAILLILIANISPLFPNDISAIGASAAVMSIAIAACSYRPENKVYLFGTVQIKLQWIAIFLIASDVLFFYNGNTGGHIAHLAGAGIGFLFSWQLKQGKDVTTKINKLISRLLSISLLNSKQSKLKVAYSKSTRSMSDEEYNKRKHFSQELVDEILDKISKNGYESLTKKEKEILFNYSKK